MRTGEATHPESLLMDVKAVAAALDICEQKVRRMRATGLLPSVNLGRCVRFRRADVERLAREGDRPKGRRW
jgi:excisionase family DNA binding protein